MCYSTAIDIQSFRSTYLTKPSNRGGLRSTKSAGVTPHMSHVTDPLREQAQPRQAVVRNCRQTHVYHLHKLDTQHGRPGASLRSAALPEATTSGERTSRSSKRLKADSRPEATTLFSEKLFANPADSVTLNILKELKH